MRAAWPSSALGHRQGEGRACTPRRRPSWRSGRVAALGSDGNNDTAPSTTEGIGFPIHVLALNAMGIHLLDYLQFEDLVRQCEAARALGVPVRRRAAADRRRDGIPAQPDRGLLSAMLFLRVYGPSAAMAEVGRGSRSGGAARHVTLAPGVRPGHALLTAEVSAESADAVLDFLVSHGVARGGHRARPPRRDRPGRAPAHPATSLIWADVLGQARRNARAVSRYLVFMTVAGVIAAFGVIKVNSILIVGAMAISPDMLPDQRGLRRPGEPPLAASRGARVVTLVVGLGDVVPGRRAVTVVLDLFDLLPSGFVVGESRCPG